MWYRRAMKFTSAHRTIAVMAISVSALASCSGPEDGTSSTGTNPCGPQGCPFDYTNYDGTAAISFGAEVFPVMRRSCAFNACHGKTAGSSAGLYLGPPMADMMTVIDMALYQTIIDGLVGTPANTAMAMNRITANEPSQSFFMLKIDGCHTEAGLTCMLQPGSTTMEQCGEAMPPGQPLCADERDLFRRWISQGAQNN
jgi:hypothetical protein